MKILVIEDDYEDWLLLRALMRSLKLPELGRLEAFHASSLKEAAALLRQHDPDMVIADFYLPEGCTLELLSGEVARNPHLYVLLVSNDEHLVTLPEVGELLRERRVSFSVKNDIDARRLAAELRAGSSVSSDRHAPSREETLHVLLVDDDPAEVEILQDHCDRMAGVDLRVHWAGNTVEALRKVSGEQYALILVDYLLRGELGTHTIERLRETGVDAQIFLVSGMTGFAGAEEDVLRFLGRQQVGFISKQRLTGDRIRQALRL